MGKQRKLSRFLPLPKQVPLAPKVVSQSESAWRAFFKKQQEQADQDATSMRSLVTKQSAQALRWLIERDWKPCGPPVEGFKVPFTRTVQGKVEYLEGISAATDSRDALSYLVFTYSESARLASERGDYAKALGWAWMSGFYSGKSQDVFFESRAAGTKRKGKALVSDAIYRAAVKRAGGVTASPKSIMSSLPKEAYAIASRESHYKNIARVKSELEIH